MTSGASFEETSKYVLGLLGLIIILPVLIAVPVKLLELGKRWGTVKVNLLWMTFWCLNLIVPVFFAFASWEHLGWSKEGAMEDVQMGFVIVPSLFNVFLFAFFGWNKYPEIPRWLIRGSNIVLSLYSILAYEVIWLGFTVNDKVLIHSEWTTSKIITEGLAALFLFAMLYLPTRFLFLYDGWKSKQTWKQKLWFWGSFVLFVGVEMSRLYG